MRRYRHRNCNTHADLRNESLAKTINKKITDESSNCQ